MSKILEVCAHMATIATFDIGMATILKAQLLPCSPLPLGTTKPPLKQPREERLKSLRKVNEKKNAN